MSNDLPIFVDAKLEFTKQLCSYLTPQLFDGIKSIYDSAKDISHKEIIDENNIVISNFRIFQNLLADIPKWSQDMIDKEAQRIQSASTCDWLQNLVTACFVSHTKLLSCIKSSNNEKNVRIKVPTIQKFIHKSYIEIARNFWKNPYLLDDTLESIIYQKNIKESENIINNCICDTIRKLLPIKEILEEYLDNYYIDDIDDNGIITDGYRDSLRKIVQKELSNIQNNDSNVTNISDTPIIPNINVPNQNTVLSPNISPTSSLPINNGGGESPMNDMNEIKTIKIDPGSASINNISSSQPIVSSPISTNLDSIDLDVKKVDLNNLGGGDSSNQTSTNSSTDANSDANFGADSIKLKDFDFFGDAPKSTEGFVDEEFNKRNPSNTFNIN